MRIDDVNEIELGRYLTVKYRCIYLKGLKRDSIDLLRGIEFENYELAKKVATILHRTYGDHLEWLRYATWLSEIKQIHMAEPERFRIADIIEELGKLQKRMVTLEDYRSCESRIDQMILTK